MKELIAYHVVTDRPMEVGQHILFDETHHSGVYRRVMEQYSLVQDIYSHPEQYDAKQLEHHTLVALRELALEDVRKANYPAYPSRLSCLYVSDQLDDSERWAELFVNWGRPTYHIVQLKINGEHFIGDANNCFDATLSREQNLALAERYWANSPNLSGEPPIREILVNGSIEVLQIVKEINRNL